MLNCTDLECVLHHHHYYQHLHQLHQPRDSALSTAQDVGEEIQSPENETNAFQSLSYLDSPGENIYMIFGVLVSMVLVGVVIILLAVTISKLRKREDGQSSTIHPEQLVHQGQLNQALSTSASSLENNNLSIIQKDALDGQFVWQFPPPYPTPSTPPPQYTLYNDQDTLVHGQPGFAKGFRKNLGGRWRRLVKRKPETSDMCAPLPPELKDQLKTIYVY